MNIDYIWVKFSYKLFDIIIALISSYVAFKSNSKKSDGRCSFITYSMSLYLYDPYIIVFLINL